MLNYTLPDCSGRQRHDRQSEKPLDSEVSLQVASSSPDIRGTVRYAQWQDRRVLPSREAIEK
jgi:hypothetical protein